MTDYSSLLWIALIFTALGYAVGLLVSNLRANKPKNQPDTPHEDSQLETKLRVLQHPGSHEIRLEMGQQNFAGPDELDADQRAKLIKIIAQLRPWVGQPEPPQPVPSGIASPGIPTPSPKTTGMPTAGPIPAAETGAVVAGSETNSPIPAGNLSMEATEKRINLNPFSVIVKALASSEVHSERVTEQSILAQIDALFQEKLKVTPWKDLGARLIENPQGEIVVLIGLEQYAGIDSVPNEEIRALLRASIAEWERRADQKGKY